MLLSVIIVNWNSKAYLAECLKALQPALEAIPHEIIVIDSGSFDGSGEMIAGSFPKVLFIQSADNLGFVRANNLASLSATGEYLLLLNPDTVVQPDAIHELLAAAKRLPDSGVLGARLMNTDGTLQTSCVQAFPTVLGELLNWDYLRRRFPKARLWGMEALFKDPPEVAPVDMVSGACMLIKRSHFEQVHRFSLEYFMYVEDVDLCLKVMRSGKVNYYVPKAVITHHGGGSSRRVSGFAAVNRAESLRRYFAKWKGQGYGRLFRALQGVAACARIVVLGISEFVRSSRKETGGREGSMARWRAIAAWSFGVRRGAD